MKAKEIKFTGANGVSLPGIIWYPLCSPTMVVQITHGMTEHKGLKNAEEGKTAPMPKFETSVELLDPMAEVQKGSEVEEEKPAENSADENAALLAKLLSNPDTAALLKALAKTI